MQKHEKKSFFNKEMAGKYFLILYAPMLFRTASIIFGNVLRAVGATVLRMVAVSEPFYGFSIIVEGFMQGGKTKEPFVYNIIGMWGIRIVGTFVCSKG